MDELISSYGIEVVESGCAPGSGRYGVRIALPHDISAVFPYLNAVRSNAWYDPENQIVIWREPRQAYAFRSHDIRIARIEDPLQAQQAARQIVNEVNAVWRDRLSVPPLFTTRKNPSVIDIFKLLPKSNCKKCGYATCLAFAAAFRSGEADLSLCLPLGEGQHAGNKEKILQLTSAD
jgi:ArsR family metal-binding transcriptional regulator